MSHPYAAEVDRLLAKLEKHGFTPADVDDTEELVKTPTWEAVKEAILAVDECRVWVKTMEGKEVCLFIVLGNSPGELVADYTVNTVLDKVLRELYDEETA